MPFLNKTGTTVRRWFISGLLAVVPLIATYLVLRLLFNSLDGILGPLTRRYFGHDVPGLGVAVTIILIFLAGIITTNYVGAWLYRWGDKFLIRTPLVRIIYSATKQLMESMASPNARVFSEVVLVEYPRLGIYTMGFLSGKSRVKKGGDESDMFLVFLPSTPTPFTGMTVLFPKSEIYPLDISMETAVKLLVSGGIASPETLPIKETSESGEVFDAAG